MANVIEQRGFFWWFTDDPLRPAQSKETSVPGLLTVTENGRTTLEVDGTLATNDEHADWSKPRTFAPGARIAGILDTAGDHILLEGVERTDFSISHEAPQRQSFIAETCTQRSFPFPGNYKPDNFVELRIDLKGLEDWLKLDSIHIKEDYTANIVRRSQVSYTDHKFEFRIDDGTISIESMTTGVDGLYIGNGPLRSVRIDQSFSMTFRPDVPADLSYLQYTFAKVEELLSLLLGVYFRLTRPTFVRKEEPFDCWNTVFSHGVAPSVENLSPFFILVPFSDVRERFGPLFQAWLNGSEACGAGFYLYTAFLRNPHVYMEDRLFTLATGIEALHRRSFDTTPSASSIQEKNQVNRVLSFLPEADRKWLSKKLAHAHEPSLEKRLLACLRELPLRFGKSELEKFVKLCAHRRNDISHRGGPGADTDYDTFYQETSRLAEALGYLFHGLILHKTGLSENALIRAMTSSWVADRRIKPAFVAAGLNIQSEPLAPEPQ